MLNLCSILSCFVVPFHNADVNIDPLSVMMSLGILCSRNICLMKSSEKCCVFICLAHGRKYPIYVSRSMTIKIALFQADFGTSVMKSIDIDFHG